MSTMSRLSRHDCERQDETIHRKVTSSGVIWLGGRAYYVSRRLAGRVLPVSLAGGMLVVDAAIPIRKEYRLPPVSGPRGLRSGERGRGDGTYRSASVETT